MPVCQMAEMRFLCSFALAKKNDIHNIYILFNIKLIKFNKAWVWNK